MTCAYDFSLPGLEGGTVDLSAWRGRPILIANTASKCGFTPQYEGLQHLWATFGRNDDDGLMVIGVPSNDFGQQEPGSSSEITGFCNRNYGVSFPMTMREPVRGATATPLFRWLAQEGGFLARPRWNFYKYLINREGRLARWYTPLTRPDSPTMIDAVHRVLLDR